MYHGPMNGSSLDIAAFILAGGNSSRMGAEKAFVLLDGRTLLARALELCRSVTSDVRIVARTAARTAGDAAKFAAFAPVVEDVFSGCGPLGGIHAALRASPAELNLILAVDMPLVTPALLQYLLARARESSATVTLAQAGGRRQPLCAVYRREFAGTAERALRAGRYKIDALFASPSTQLITEPELEAAGFSRKQFRNLNTQQELAEASETTNASLSSELS